MSVERKEYREYCRKCSENWEPGDWIIEKILPSGRRGNWTCRKCGYSSNELDEFTIWLVRVTNTGVQLLKRKVPLEHKYGVKLE